MPSSVLHKLWVSSPKEIADWLLFDKRRQLDPRIADLIGQDEAERLEKLPRYTRTSTTFMGRPMEIVDPVSFLAMCDEIFLAKNYEFEARCRNPLILDCGANIGISVIYFKNLYPEARVVAFEADPTIFPVLRSNITAFGFENVTLRNKAVWTCEADLDFHCEGGSGGRLINAQEAGRRVTVEAERLRDLLCEHVDLLKIDVEGAETAILTDCSDRLDRIDHVFVEYHSLIGERQTLHVVLEILESAGFRYHIKEAVRGRAPFIAKLPAHSPMDLQLNIFAYRL